MKKLLLMKTVLLLCALVAGSSSVWADKYVKITSSSDLVVGAEYLLVSGTEAYSGVSSNIGQHVTVTFTDGDITSISTAHVLQLGGSSDAWTFYDKTDNKYIAYTSTATSSSNNLYQVSSGTDNGTTWKLTVSTSAVTMRNNYNTGRWMRYNTSNPRFCCYYSKNSESSTGAAVTLYKKYVDDTAAPTTVTVNSTGITNTNKFLGTAAGTLTAAVTVTSTSAAVDGATVTWSSSNTSVATVGASTGVVTLVGKGSTTITASYAGETGVYRSSSADYVLNVTDEDPNAVTLWSEDFSTSGYSDRVTTYSYTTTNSSAVQASDSYAGGSAPEMMVRATAGTFQAIIPIENILGDLKLKFKTNAKGITVSTSTTGVSISGDASFNTKEEHIVTFTGVTTSMTSITITFTAGSDNVRLDDIVLKGSKVVPITPAYAKITYVTPYKMDFSDVDGLKAYVATAADGNGVTMTRVEAPVPANTPLLLIGTASTTYNVPVVASATAPATNYLVKGDGSTDMSGVTGYNYILYSDGKFYQVTSGTIATTKAYLHLESDPAGARSLNLIFDDGETTGISDALRLNDKGQMTNDSYFDLQGRRIAQPTKGLYIVNGKKVVIK